MACKKLDFAPTAKRVIRIHMIGAVSQVDTFDYKPMLDKMHGQEIPPSIRCQRTAFDHERGAIVVSYCEAP